MDFIIKQTDTNDISDVIRIIREVYELLPQERKVWFVVDPEEDMRKMLESDGGRAYKAVEASTGEIAGVLTVVFPKTDPCNLGNDIGLPAEELAFVVHMDTAVVMPQYRGFQLQKRLMQYAETELAREGCRYLCCTAHPENVYSKNNILAQGYQIMTTKEKYGGFLRHVFMKKIN